MHAQHTLMTPKNDTTAVQLRLRQGVEPQIFNLQRRLRHIRSVSQNFQQEYDELTAIAREARAELEDLREIVDAFDNAVSQKRFASGLRTLREELDHVDASLKDEWTRQGQIERIKNTTAADVLERGQGQGTGTGPRLNKEERRDVRWINVEVDQLVDQGGALMSNIRLQDINLRGASVRGRQMLGRMRNSVSHLLTAAKKAQNRENVILWSFATVCASFILVFTFLR